MINKTEISSNTHISGNGIDTQAYIIGNKAYLFTPTYCPIGARRIKYEIYKAYNLLYSVDRCKTDEICICVKRLIKIYAEGYEEIYQEWIDERYKVKRLAEAMSLDRHSLDFVLELAVRENEFPVYGKAARILIESKMDFYETDFRGFDDHDGNVMIDPDSKEIIPIDILFVR